MHLTASNARLIRCCMQELHALQRQVDEKCHPTGLCSFTAFVWRFALCYTEQEEKRLCSSGWISKGRQGSGMNPTTALAPAPLQCYHANRIRGLLGPNLQSWNLNSCCIILFFLSCHQRLLSCSYSYRADLGCDTSRCHSPFLKENFKGRNVLHWTG